MPSNDIIRTFILQELVADAAGKSLSDTDKLIDSGIIDSFGIMSLLSFLENEFSIQVSGDDLVPENFESISTIASLIGRKSEYRPEA